MIDEIICDLLKDLDVELFYIHKPDAYKVDPYITFNFTRRQNWFSDSSHEMDKYYITLNIVSKNSKDIINFNDQIQKIIDKSTLCFNCVNQGGMYIKDTQEFFNATTFYMFVPQENIEK